MVVGGYANAVWGEPRATLDIDVVLWRPEPRVDELLAALGSDFRSRVPDPVQFAEETRVVPVVMAGQMQVDLILALFSFEKRAIERAVEVEFYGRGVRVATAEDLILLKIASTRQRDLDDIRGIVKRRRDELDYGYLDPLVNALSQTLERPEIRSTWEAIRDRR